jgi:type I restriction enzyme S subunit
VGEAAVNDINHAENLPGLRKLKPYPAYKDSGIEWLGNIPAHWDSLSISRVTLSRCDGPFGTGLKSEHYFADGVRVIRLQNIGWTKFVDDDRAYIDDKYALELGDHSVMPNDLLIAGLGDERHPVGRACIAPDDIGPAMVKADCFRFRLDRRRIFPPFAAYQLSATAVALAGSLSTGSTRARMNLTATASRKIALPPCDEQHTVAAFLDRETAKIDALVAKKERLIELLQEKRTALITRAVTKGLDPNVPMKDSGVEWLGVIPAHWQVRRIAMAAVKITNGFVGPTRDILVNDGVRYLQSLHIKDGAIDFERRPYFVESEWSRQHAKSLLSEGDVLVVQTGDIGQAAAVPREFAGCNCHALIIIRLESTLGVGEWLARALLSDYGQNALTWSKTGALHPHLECGHAREIRVAFPPMDEQRIILEQLAGELNQIDAMIAKVRDAITRLSEFRMAIISAAVTGKIDVREEAA